MGERHLIARRAHVARRNRRVDFGLRVIFNRLGCDEADRAQMFLKLHADHRGQGWHVFSLDPVAAARIENLGQFLQHEAGIVAGPQDRRDHARERHDERHVPRILRIDENLEGPAPRFVNDVVDAKKVAMIPPPDFVSPAFQHSSLSKAEIEIATNLTNARWLAGYSNYEHEIIGERDGGLPPEKVEALIAGLPTSFEDPRQQVVYQITSALITLRLEIGEGLDDVVVVLDDRGRIDIQSKTTANLSQSQTSPLGRSYGS
jgi:hypothetical protein